MTRPLRQFLVALIPPGDVDRYVADGWVVVRYIEQDGRGSSGKWRLMLTGVKDVRR